MGASRWAQLLGAAVVVILGGSALDATGQAAPPGPAPVDDGVVAQTLVDLGPGTYHWSGDVISAASPDDGGVENSLPTGALAFVVVHTGAVTVGEGASMPSLLGPGQAAVLPGADASLVVPTGDAATLLHIVVAPVADDATDSFTLDGGRYDVELVRRVLLPGGTLTLAEAATPTLIRAEGGPVLVANDLGAAAATVDADSTSVLDGNLTAVNTAAVPVAVIAARIIGPVVAGATPESSTGSEPVETAGADAAATSSSPGSPSPATSTVTAPTAPASTAPASTTPPTTVGATPGPTTPGTTLDPATVVTQPSSFRDADGDGLSDADEASLGSDPNMTDSDSDGLSDYWEWGVTGTSLTNWDTDGDGAGDGYEIGQGADPRDPTSVP